jgi:hypothetical protein
MSRVGRIREHERAEALRLKPVDGPQGERCCAWPGCGECGAYRAPVARNRLREFQFFCLDHVREFNSKWNFFAGMSPAEIEQHQRADVTWHRPSWRFGTRAGSDQHWRDMFGLFGEEAAQSSRRPIQPVTKVEQMVAVLELEVGFTLDELKARFKALVKQHHPDLHGGDKAAEERLKLIIEAYTYLREQQAYV